MRLHAVPCCASLPHPRPGVVRASPGAADALRRGPGDAHAAGEALEGVAGVAALPGRAAWSGAEVSMIRKGFFHVRLDTPTGAPWDQSQLFTAQLVLVLACFWNLRGDVSTLTT